MAKVSLQAMPFEDTAVQALLAEWIEEIAIRIPGFDPALGANVHDGDFSAPDGVFVVAADDGRLLGCGGVRRLGDGTCEIKRLFVRRAARGRGVGRMVMVELERRAVLLGFERVLLDTHGREPSAVALFQALGYREIPDYNGNPYARHWFEKAL